jgi:oligoendopeptidase F
MIDKLCMLVTKLDPEFSTFIRTMQDKNQLDLDTRPNKAP